MSRSVHTQAPWGGGAAWKLCVLTLWVLLCASLTACGTDKGRSLGFEPPPEESWNTSQGGQDGGNFAPGGAMAGKTEILIPGTPNSYDLPKPITTLAMRGCSIKDRFDRKSTLAYNFEDGQSQLALNMRVRGPSFSDPGRLEFRGAEMRFTYKLQKTKNKKEHCRYASPVQGLLGSAYNEFALREEDTIVQELRAKGLDF